MYHRGAFSTGSDVRPDGMFGSTCPIDTPNDLD